MHVYSVVFYMCLLLHTVYQCASYCDGVRISSEFPFVMHVYSVVLSYYTQFTSVHCIVME